MALKRCAGYGTIDSELEVVIMTAYSDKPLGTIIGGMKLLHKLLYVRKPFAREEIQQISLSLVKKWNLERNLAERRLQLRNSHQRLEAVLDATGDAMAMYDCTEQLVFANRWYESVFGMPLAKLKRLSMTKANEQFWLKSNSLRLPTGVQWSDGTITEVGVFKTDSQDARASRQPLYSRRQQSVQDRNGDRIGELIIYRDLTREIEIERMKTEVGRLRTELESTYSLAGIIGSSLVMRRVGELIQCAADSDVSVLVTGESGTGKELVAKALHFSGARKNGPFVAVNCAAVPETLIESEMFGYERGAFSGATSRRAGCFERAHGGTLLLDEIGDMPLVLQSKLLRVLQEREVRRIGGSRMIPFNIRVVASTHANLQVAISEGLFREDLYYRLAVFPIEVPPLRARVDDIPLLVEHFRKKHAGRLGVAVKSVSPAANALLARHNWPGNVRELENVVCRCLVVETSDVLRASTLPANLLQTSASPTPESLVDIERNAILSSLTRLGHNLAEVATELGIHRSTLYRKIKKHRISVRRS